jgi:hypothetical protein
MRRTRQLEHPLRHRRLGCSQVFSEQLRADDTPHVGQQVEHCAALGPLRRAQLN